MPATHPSFLQVWYMLHNNRGMVAMVTCMNVKIQVHIQLLVEWMINLYSTVSSTLDTLDYCTYLLANVLLITT